MARQVQQTPVTGTCKRTGAIISFPSMKATEAEGFDSKKIRQCVRGRAKSHGGFYWKADGPLRPSKGAPRQLEAARLYNDGLNYEQIGQTMGLSPNVARLYVNNCRALGNVITRNVGRFGK